MTGVVLDAYAARSCPVKTQNLFHPGVQRVDTALDNSLGGRFAGGEEFQARVLDAIVERFRGTVLDCRPLREEPWAVRESTTVEALHEGVDLIVGGLLPQDLEGHRNGRADLYVRGADTEDGRPGYYPVEVKFHAVVERGAAGTPYTPLRCSSLDDPRLESARVLANKQYRYGSREGALLQMAHYWRQLEAFGFAAAGPAWAGIIGTDQLSDLGNAHAVSWVRLDEKRLTTYSRSREGAVRRTVLERYDHEFQFRLKVADVALRQTGSPDDPPLMVSPIFVAECKRCPWWETCEPQFDAGDLSLHIDKSPLDVREISVLRSFGITSITDLAGHDLETLLPQYLPLVGHRSGAEDRLRLAARRAVLMRDGIELERIRQESAKLPAVADVEIDFDIETSADSLVYLWGFLVRETAIDGPGEYVSFAAFRDLDRVGEATLAQEAARWLVELVESRPEAGAAIFHYSPFEIDALRRIADESGDAWVARALELVRARGCDMYTVMKEQYFGVHGLGLKHVVTSATDFAWRDDDPGGLNSQAWFADAVHAETPEARDAARRRVLEYNEDDVRATSVLREWLRAQG